MSAVPPTAAQTQTFQHFSLVPKGDILASAELIQINPKQLEQADH